MYEDLDRQHTHIMSALSLRLRHKHKVRKERLQHTVQQFGDSLQQALTDAGVTVVGSGEGYLLLSLPAIGKVMLIYGGRHGYRIDGGMRLLRHRNSTIRRVVSHSYTDTQSLVWLLQELKVWGVGYLQCSGCWYSNQATEYCGRGLEMNTGTCNYHKRQPLVSALRWRHLVP